MEKWEGKLAVITGASSGIGAAILKDLAKAGVNVVGLARRVEKIQEIINKSEEVTGKMYAYKCDVSDQESVTAAFKWIEDTFGSFQILVNNAGVERNVQILDEGDEAGNKLNEVIKTNFTGLVHCTREGFRLIKKSDDYGFIININSILGHINPFMRFSMNMYPATKYAVRATSEVIRQELICMNNTKIRVSNISPGAVKTDIGVAAGFSKPTEGHFDDIPHLKDFNVSQSVLYLLSTPYNVNVTELTVRPVGENF
ncbi:unnamed protein product [Diamesa tonsa]